MTSTHPSCNLWVEPRHPFYSPLAAPSSIPERGPPLGELPGGVSLAGGPEAVVL